MNISVSNEAVEFIKKKGGSVIIFQGSLTGCCVGNVPWPMLEIGYPRRPLENYNTIDHNSGIIVYLDKDIAFLDGTGEITLEKNLWWKQISFKYIDSKAIAEGNND